jgi:hypothetical protein
MPLIVEIVGLFPTVFSLCAHCCTTDYISACSPGNRAEQLSEYPAEVRANQEAAERLFAALWAEVGERVAVRVVDAASVRGIWLCWRHRLGRGPAALVAGRPVRTLDPAAVLAQVRAALPPDRAAGDPLAAAARRS